jgi:hypothetical protein
MTATKVVQTRLDLSLYEALQDAAREAIRRWIADETQFADSPLFNFEVVLGRGPKTDSGDDDAILYRGRKRRSSS